MEVRCLIKKQKKNINIKLKAIKLKCEIIVGGIQVERSWSPQLRKGNNRDLNFPANGLDTSYNSIMYK